MSEYLNDTAESEAERSFSEARKASAKPWRQCVHCGAVGSTSSVNIEACPGNSSGYMHQWIFLDDKPAAESDITIETMDAAIKFVKDLITEPSLSLLVIDLGESCVVKQEAGRLVDLPLGKNTYSFIEGNVHHWHFTFDEVRAAIDGHKQFAIEPPVPRIENVADKFYLVTTATGNAGGNYLWPEDYTALCSLAKQAGAAQDLPIFDPTAQTGGTWAQVYYGIGDNLVKIEDAAEVNIWRFRK